MGLAIVYWFCSTRLNFGVTFETYCLVHHFILTKNLVSTYSGSFIELLTPFALLCGVVSVAMLTMQGGVYLAHRTTEHPILCKNSNQCCSIGYLIVICHSRLWVQSLDGYLLVGDIDGGAVIDPLSKQVQIQSGAWLTNFMIILGCGYYPLWGFDASDGDYLLKIRTHLLVLLPQA